MIHYPVLSFLCAVIPGAAGSREVCVASQRPSAGRQQRISSVASAVDSDCSRTAPGHCYVSTQQLQQRQVPQRPPTADHPRNAAGNDVWVRARLLQAAANADVDPFHNDGGSIRVASVAAVPPRGLSYTRRRAQLICQESQTTQLRAVAKLLNL